MLSTNPRNTTNATNAFGWDPTLDEFAIELPNSATIVHNPTLAFDVMRSMGKAIGIPEDILCGSTSHAGKWHACSIMEHIRWCTAMACECSALARMQAGLYISNEAAANQEEIPLVTTLDDLIVAAIYHDIGKVIAPQITEEGFKFHDHGPVGADYLGCHSIVSPRVAEVIRQHGAYRKEPYPKDLDVLVAYLDLCDELSKWSDHRFPPEGGDKQRRNRQKNVEKAMAAGVPSEIVYQLVERNDRVADSAAIAWEEGRLS